MPEEMFLLAKKEDIGCYFFDLPYPLLGIYDCRTGEPSIILLDNGLKANRRLLRCVLAEELGHHFTTAFDLMAFALKDNRYIIEKYEKLAIFWAVQYLVPFESFVEAVNSGLTLTYELAEHFDVTERFMSTSIKLYNQKKRAMDKLLKYKLQELL